MKEIFGSLAVLLVVILIAVGISWIIMGNEFFLYKYFAPKQESVRREVFEKSKAYNQGMIQELQNMQFEYIKADSNHQPALASVILHRAADYPEDKMPEDLRTFIRELKSNKQGY